MAQNWSSWTVVEYQRTDGGWHEVYDANDNRVGPYPQTSTIADCDKVVVRVDTEMGPVFFTVHGPFDPSSVWDDIELEIEDAMDSDVYGVADAA